MNAKEYVQAHKNDEQLDLKGLEKGDNHDLINKIVTIDRASRVENGGAPYYIIIFHEEHKKFFFSFSTLTQYLEGMHEDPEVWASVNRGELPPFEVEQRQSKNGRDYLRFDFYPGF